MPPSVCYVDSDILVNRNFEPGEEDEIRDRLEEDVLEYLERAHEINLADASEDKPEKENTTAVSVIIDIVNMGQSLRAMECSVKWDSLEMPKWFALTTSIGNEKRFDLIQILDGARAAFGFYPAGDTMTRMEVPTTWDEWDDFFNLRLFGPTPIMQVSICY